MDHRPLQWRADRAVAISDDDAEVWLFGEAGPVRLAGAGSGPLARAVDGHRDLAALITQATDAGMRPRDATRIAGKWLAAGHLRPVPPPTGEPRVSVAGDEKLAAALGLAGVQVADDSPDLAVLVLDELLELGAFQTPLTATVVVQLRGQRALVSPVLGPDRTCARCLLTRLQNRRRVDLIAAARVGREVPPPPALRLPGVEPLVAGVVAALARDLFARRTLGQDIAVIDPGVGSVSRQRVNQVPRCPQCDPAGQSVLMRHIRTATLDTEGDHVGADTGGGLRVVDPDVTWQKYNHLVGDVVGIVAQVRQTGDAMMRTFSAGMNVAAVDDLMVLKSRLRSGAGGKGITLAGARAGALAEALERDSLRARGDEPHRRARMADLPGAIHPNAIQLFSDAQMQRQAQLQALGIEDPATSGFHRVPLPFDVEAEHDWSPVTDLVTGEVHWLPSALLWFGWPGVPDGYPLGCSNGAAAGNTVKEALLQGLLELVERDSVALWWHPRCLRPAIDLEVWDDPRIDAAVAPQRALGTDFWVLDVTSDLGIPAAVAVAVGVTALGDAPLMGYGAHLDPVIAVTRALTELAQMQAPFTGMPDPTPIDFPGEAERTWFAQVTVETEPWLAPHSTVAPRESPGHESVDSALDDVVQRLTSRGLQVLWADCTRPDIGLPVVRTFVPGLRHFWKRTGPGRIFDVPPRLGWCDPGYTEASLNPRSMIL